MKRRPVTPSDNTHTTAATPTITTAEPVGEKEETPSRPWYDPRWWQRVVSVAALLVVLLLVAGLILRPGIQKWVSQFHSEVAGVVPRATPAPRRLPHVTTSLPLVRATPTTAPVQPTPTTAQAAPPPPVATATAEPGPATITIIIECTASKTNPGFCEFQNGSTITAQGGGASCSLTLGVWSYVGQQTEAVGCAEPHGSAVSFVGAPVPCSTDGKGACSGDVASQQHN